MEKIQGILAVLQKDLILELRSKYAINTVLAFVGSSLLLVIFSLKAQVLPPTPRSGLVWIIILFASLSSLSRSFVLETERNTFDLLRIHADPNSVLLGKFFYNFFFTLMVNVVTMTAYIYLLGISVQDWLILLLTVLLGTVGLAAISTLLAAIVSQASRKGAIFSVLSIPLLVPLDLLLVNTTKAALASGKVPGVWNDITALIGFAGVMLTASIMLFEYIWED
ncbi:MAG TPA: heme exporter protein CcmB [Balneolales bacterium]|nr:heme exporter protein CcmB [Balneolales bacterium]